MAWPHQAQSQVINDCRHIVCIVVKSSDVKVKTVDQMNMRPPGGPSTMPATSDLLGDNSNDSVAWCQPLSSGQIQPCLNDDISLVSILESEHSLQLLSVWLQYAGRPCNYYGPIMHRQSAPTAIQSNR